MRRTLAACTVALALVAACGDDPVEVAETGTTLSTTTTAPESSSTTGTEGQGGGGEGGGSGGESTSTTAGATTSTTEPQGSADSAEEAAAGLYGAWTAGDESAAPGFAEQAAVDAIFEEDGAAFGEGATDEGCTEADGPTTCSWTSGDQTLTMTVEEGDDGWLVVEVTFSG